MDDNDKIILHTLKFIQRETKYKPFVNTLTTLWKDWTSEKQNFFHGLLWDMELVRLNTYQWELQLTTKGKHYIEAKDKEIEGHLLDYLTIDNDIRPFMAQCFVEPDNLSPYTKNETDDGVIFLKNLKARKLIDYDDGVLNQINTDLIPRGGKQHKRWFNSMTGDFVATPIGHFLEDLPIKTPTHQVTATAKIKYHIGTWLNKDWVKFTLIGVLILIIWFFLYPLFKLLFPQFDLP